MSAYYFAFAPPTSDLRDFPTRVIFVGILFALGFFLILYRGFSRTENWALNIAGLSAIVVALFPMHTPNYCNNCGSDAYTFVHWTAAVVLFACMAFVAWACTEETLVQLPGRSRQRFRMGYYALAISMIIAPIAAILMTYVFGLYDKKTFFVEWFSIATFSAYWALKSYELHKSGAETMAMKGQMPATNEALLCKEGASPWIDRRTRYAGVLRQRAAECFLYPSSSGRESRKRAKNFDPYRKPLKNGAPRPMKMGIYCFDVAL